MVAPKTPPYIVPSCESITIIVSRFISHLTNIPMVIPAEDAYADFVPSVAYIPQEEVTLGLVECIVETFSPI